MRLRRRMSEAINKVSFLRAIIMVLVSRYACMLNLAARRARFLLHRNPNLIKPSNKHMIFFVIFPVDASTIIKHIHIDKSCNLHPPYVCQSTAFSYSRPSCRNQSHSLPGAGPCVILNILPPCALASLPSPWKISTLNFNVDVP